MAGSYLALAQTREPEDTEKIIPEEETHFWENAKIILRRDMNFNWFIAVRFLSQFATMGFAFYIIYGVRRFGMDEVTAGYMTAALTLAQTFANAGMGWLGDRWGHRAMLILGAFAAIASSLLTVFTSSLHWLYLSFILAGLAYVSIYTIGIAFTVDFGNDNERPTYIGLSNTLITPATVLAPIIGGWMVDNVGFQITFILSALVGVITVGVLIFVVKDPRMKTL